MCRDQNLISGDEQDLVACSVARLLALSERMKIEKPGVGRPLLGPAIKLISYVYHDTIWVNERGGKFKIPKYFVSFSTPHKLAFLSAIKKTKLLPKKEKPN